ncbi:hypothetical protein B7494_g8401 [Chlorociboria aeruginascens]|nr:hypothetical protein B7494_g8401 [Chlorociboria aeruginascens]
MSRDYPSSNPFRRKDPSSTVPAQSPSILNDINYQEPPSYSSSPKPEHSNLPKKPTKKVRVQSPPPSSPTITQSASTIGYERDSIALKPPTPIPRDQITDDPFDSASSEASEDGTSKLKKAPPNPFQKTLETMESSVRDGLATAPTNLATPARASLDVDAFKRLLMTGNSGLSTMAPSLHPSAAHHGLGDGGSSTDTSSISRQSIFEAIQDAHLESPRTSHEISEPEDDHRGLIGALQSSGRKKPPPPNSRHGKLIKVELRDESTSNALISIPMSSSGGFRDHKSPGSISNRSLTDLNKPLPPAPNRGSLELDRESVFDKESAGKVPEPPSPSASVSRKTPPAPPLTRRHSQLVPDSKLTRNDAGRLSPKAEEENTGPIYIDPGRPRSSSFKAPPPPPSRRPQSIRESSNPLSPSLPSTPSIPPPPPTRGSSRSSMYGRPPSIHSMDLSTNKRVSGVPPPPPPHRRNSTRNSFEDPILSPSSSVRVSGEYSRQIDDVRRGSVASSLTQVEQVGSPAERKDILADLSALQRDIDALRGQSETENVT